MEVAKHGKGLYVEVGSPAMVPDSEFVLQFGLFWFEIGADLLWGEAAPQKNKLNQVRTKHNTSEPKSPI